MKEKKIELTKPRDQVASKASEFAIFNHVFTQSDVDELGRINSVLDHSKKDNLEFFLKKDDDNNS